MSVDFSHSSGIVRLVPAKVCIFEIRPHFIIVHHGAAGDIGTIAIPAVLSLSRRSHVGKNWSIGGNT